VKKRLKHPHPILRMLRLVGGLLLLFIGLIGFALPVMPGWPFVLPALALLAPESRYARRLIVLLRTRLRLRRLNKNRRRAGEGGAATGVAGKEGP
jgi:uncharacterized membrane protein YbaN (DUF454 family)